MEFSFSSVLFAGRLSPYALEPLAGGSSAVVESIKRAKAFPGSGEVILLVDEATDLSSLSPVSEGIRILRSPDWTKRGVLSALSELSSGVRNLYWAWADTPLLDPLLAGAIRDRHLRYAAEYSYADGWPAGLSPEILAPGIAGILLHLLGDEDGPVERDLLFSVIKKDINSFDIETEIAPQDLRSHRLLLAADSKRNKQLVEGWLEAGYRDASSAASLIADRGDLLRTLPAFYAIQISGRCPQSCALCPYPRFGMDAAGRGPLDRRDLMPLEPFVELLDRIVSFSGDAVIDLSPWGEPSLHPDIASLAAAVLERPELSLVIETSGLSWSPAALDALSIAAERARQARRDTGLSRSTPPLSWIVSLDADDPSLYERLRGPGREEAQGFAAELIRRFPGVTYVQTLRTRIAEDELETFYRGWKAKGAQVIVQKHDSFCGRMEDLKVADLSPITRHSCWHLMRDMTVLIDGTVPLCREDLDGEYGLGNVFSDSLETIWNRAADSYAAHVAKDYPALCRNCDEYYTYNF